MKFSKGRSLFAVLAVMTLILGIAVIVWAAEAKQATPTETDPKACLEVCLQLVRTDIQSQKAILVAENLVLTDKEAQGFWPLYRKYDVDMIAINDRTVAFLKEYGSAAGYLSDQKAAELLGTWFDIQEQKLRLRRDYSKKFREVLPAAKVARFFQIDNRIDLMLQLQIAKNLPMLERAEGN